MTSINRAGPATEPVLPTSRRPVPGSEEYRQELAARAAAAGDGASRDRARSADEIEAELRDTTERLAANIDELTARLNPKYIAARSAGRFRAMVVTPSGRPRAEFVGAAVGAMIGVAALVWWSRRR